MTWSAAIGRLKTELSSSEMMYAPPLFCDMTMSRPRYLTHFAIERLLDGGMSDQDEVTELEVIFDDGGSMLLFEKNHGFDLCRVYVGGEHCQVRSTFLLGDSAPSNKC